jgi:hypothetical protein
MESKLKLDDLDTWMICLFSYKSSSVLPYGYAQPSSTQ